MNKNHELIQLEICERRGMVLDKELDKRLYNLKKGFKGEYSVYQWFQEYSKQNIQIIDDYWFYHGKNMQIDLLVLMDNRWLVVEVKNYHGNFEYRNNDCYLNGKLMSDNHFDQLAHRTKRLRHIAAELNSNIEVDSIMVFIDEHCEVSIQSEISTQVIQRHQLKFFIESWSKERNRNIQGQSMQNIISHLDKYRVASPYQPILLNDKKLPNEIRKGIYCPDCLSYNTQATHRVIKCMNCGNKEYKKIAVHRLSSELRYIHYYQPEKVTTHAIFELCGGRISKENIYRAMATKYTRVEKGPKSYYKVPLE